MWEDTFLKNYFLAQNWPFCLGPPLGPKNHLFPMFIFRDGGTSNPHGQPTTCKSRAMQGLLYPYIAHFREFWSRRGVARGRDSTPSPKPPSPLRPRRGRRGLGDLGVRVAPPNSTLRWNPSNWRRCNTLIPPFYIQQPCEFGMKTVILGHLRSI